MFNSQFSSDRMRIGFLRKNLKNAILEISGGALHKKSVFRNAIALLSQEGSGIAKRIPRGVVP
jgi:hypothetical protein